MRDKRQIDEEVRRTLELLKPRERIQCSPGFQARLMAGTGKFKSGGRQYRFGYPTRTFVAAVFAFLVVFINATSLIWVLNDTETPTYSNKSYLTAVVEDYQKSSGSDYLIYFNNRTNQ